MVDKKEGVTLTDVDAFVDLLQRRKRISMEQAAKELKTVVSTVENLVSVLEEEGIVATKYSLTTPFIELKQTKDGKHDVIFDGKDEKLKVEAEPMKALPSKDEKVGKELIAPEVTDINLSLTHIRSLINEGNFSAAKNIYSQVKKSYDSLPIVFLQRKNEIETELIHLNNELSIALQKQGFKQIKEGTVLINNLLKQGYVFVKKKNVDDAVELYNQIKTTYDSMPDGFYGEKTKLAEGILKFFQRLSSITNQLNEKDMQVKTRQILGLVLNIESFIAKGNIENAIATYGDLKQIYSSLPPGFLDQKLDIQEKMINIYRQLMVDKKSRLRQDILEKINTIKQLLKYAHDYMKNRDIENGVKSFNEARAIFEKMPKAFSKEYNHAQNMLLKSYKQLIELKKYVSIQIIKQGSLNINHLIDEAQAAHNNKDFNVAYDLYRQIIDKYNTFPTGFDPVKLEVRKKVYKLYYDVLSGKDFVELGELSPYVKTRYLKLLDLLVSAHQIVDSNQFSLIGQIYNNIYSLYNELPLYLVNKKFLLKQEIRKVFEIYRLYQAALSLNKYYNASDMRGLRFVLKFINHNFVSAQKNCYGFVKILKFIKQYYDKYAEKLHLEDLKVKKQESEKKKPAMHDFRQSPRIIMPIPEAKHRITSLDTEEEERAKIDAMFKLKKSKQLHKAALKNIRERDYTTAVRALEAYLRLNPRDRKASDKLIEIKNLREDKFKDSIVNKMISAKKSRLKKYMHNQNFDSALQEIYTILELDPDNTEAKLFLDKINFESNKAKT